ncbi:hypothetical protein BKA61DRAFT_737735 [Leptodontidium sp. MPI-SDFR-AT-0119]|nr:hypothetical protein BKA61DRAFT_737735 [Leptodontidium sp. MPI-SDFR-AT-0119]
MSSPESPTLPDPRLSNRIAHFNRDEIISSLLAFYNFLPHVPASDIHSPPADGWPEITSTSLTIHGIHKTPEAIELLRHLPYLSGDQPWIMITALACDYRRVAMSPTAREKPGWLFDAADKQWPAWVVQLTAGTDREGSHYMLDTTDGTVTRYCAGGRFEYPPTYAPDDARSWRDRECNPETVTLRDWLKQWREMYRQMTVLTVPADPFSYGSVDPCFGALEAEPGSYCFEQIDALRKIYTDYGWPDLEIYQKDACVQAIKIWYQEFLELRQKQDETELRNYWETRGIVMPEPSTTLNIWAPKILDKPAAGKPEIVTYYETWNSQHSCGTMEPEEIPVQQLTHLIVAFGYVTPGDFRLTNVSKNKNQISDRADRYYMDGVSTDMAMAKRFPNMVSSSSTRATFIKNLLGFLDQYGYDGVDFDWEYPGADDRGGSKDNGVDFTTFLKELRAAVKASSRDYIVTFIAPTSYWYLRHFDITVMTKEVDWINLMAYDLHGVWDRDNPIGSQVLAHTNLTELDVALDLYWRNDNPPEKIVLGLAATNLVVNFPDPELKQSAQPLSGILSCKEITDIIATTGARPVHDKTAQINYLVYGGNNWISYDDKTTYQANIDFANKEDLGGLMLWAIDQDNTAHDALNGISNLDASDLLQFDEDGGASLAHSTDDASTCDKCDRGGVTYCCPVGNKQQYLNICTWTECGAKSCPDGKPYELTTDLGGSGHGQTNKQCKATEFDSIDRDPIEWEERKLCCPSKDSFNTKTCGWHNKKECSEACPDNQIELDSDVAGKDGSYWCSWGRTQKFCCDPPGGTSKPLTVADLDTLSPPEYLPSADSIPKYDLVSFCRLYAAGGVEDPNASGVAFILFAGNQNLLSKMKKRDNGATGVEFLDCPSDVRLLPSDEPRTVRVICLDGTLECFSVRQGGTEGTLVSMSDACGGGFARAISLELSRNQSLPIDIARQNPTSAVFDFIFDYDMANLKRDSGSLSMRVDYSNVGGYWDKVVKAPGVTKRTLDDRYFSGSNSDWAAVFGSLAPPPGDAKLVSRTVKDIVYFGYQKTCDVDGGGAIPEAIEITSIGKIDLDIWYGYSMIGTIDGGQLNIHEANGFVDVSGTTDITFEISGIGNLNTDGTLKSNLIPTSTAGAIEWNGKANARMMTNFGQGAVTFPSTSDGKSTSSSDKAESGKMFKNSLNADFSGSGDIGISHIIEAGLAVSMKLPSEATGVGKFPSMLMNSETTVEFKADNSSKAGSVCLDIRMGKKQSQSWESGKHVGWDDTGSKDLESYTNRVGTPACFETSSSAKKRAGSGIADLFPAVGYTSGKGDLTIDTIFKEYGADNDNPIGVDPLCCGCVDPDLLWGPDNRYQDGDYDGPPSAFDSDTVDNRSLLLDPTTSEYSGDYVPSNDTLDELKDLPTTSLMIDLRRPVEFTILPKRSRFVATQRSAVQVTPLTQPEMMLIGKLVFDNGAFQSVKRYDRALEACDNWDVEEINNPRILNDGSQAPYDTEHVYEGQAIGQFFSQYISQGRLSWWSPGYIPGTPVNDGRFGCTGVNGGASWVNQWIKSRQDDTWDYDIGLFQGSTAHIRSALNKLDRLVVFPTRPNIFKGALFGGGNVYTGDRFASEGYQEQLLVMKELGMVFRYMNLPDIVEAYCDVYEALYALMGRFDRWYAQQNPNGPVPALQEKWKVTTVDSSTMLLRSPILLLRHGSTGLTGRTCHGSSKTFG